jgi:hypothetical protein
MGSYDDYNIIQILYFWFTKFKFYLKPFKYLSFVNIILKTLNLFLNG